MKRSDLVLDVIRKKNTSYLPSQITFAHGSKKKEVADSLGMTNEELDVYLGNHYKITATLDDMVQVDKVDKHRMGVAIENKRLIPDKDNPNMVCDLWGMKYDLNEGGYYNYAHPLANCDDDQSLLDNFKAPSLDNMDMLFSIADEDLKKYGDDFLVILSGYNGIWEKGYELVGMEEFLYLLMQEPEKACRIMDVVTDYKVEIAKEVVRRGFKIGHHGDDLGTQISTFVSEETFVKYFKPRMKRIFDVYKSAGLPMQMHSCGKIEKLIPHLIDIGLDVLEPVQACMDFEFIKREYGKDITFYGGVDTQDLITFRSPQEVYDGTLKVIDVLGKGGGLIIGPSQDLMNNVPVENVLALMRAIKKARGEE